VTITAPAQLQTLIPDAHPFQVDCQKSDHISFVYVCIRLFESFICEKRMINEQATWKLHHAMPVILHVNQLNKIKIVSVCWPRDALYSFIGPVFNHATVEKIATTT